MRICLRPNRAGFPWAAIRGLVPVADCIRCHLRSDISRYGVCEEAWLQVAAGLPLRTLQGSTKNPARPIARTGRRRGPGGDHGDSLGHPRASYCSHRPPPGTLVASATVEVDPRATYCSHRSQPGLLAQVQDIPAVYTAFRERLGRQACPPLIALRPLEA